MRIVHVSTSDTGHGAGIAAYRLLCAQREAGIDAVMLVAEKRSDDPGVICVREEPGGGISRTLFRCDLFMERVLNVLGPQNLYSVLSRALLRHELVRSADIIHLHNLHWHSRNFSLALPFILGRQKPVVWTFHDMWPITGHCISSRDCEQWRVGCGSCPYPRAYLGQLFDTSRLQCLLKRTMYNHSNFTVVTPSRWLADKVKHSPLMKRHDVRTIPNSIARSCFRPVEKQIARELLGIREYERPAILFVSAFLDDPIKGYDYFEEALCQLHERGGLQGVQVLLAGRGKANARLKDRYAVYELGYIDDMTRMALVYSAADLYVMPSILDNLPSVVLESMACGTPVVCFDTGGIPEMVQHGLNGLVARNRDAADLAAQIETLMGNQEIREQVGHDALRTVKNLFSPELQVQRYIALYRELLDRHV
jgi:glycosyltransferase involved in cell wall biosynthesis